MRKESKLPIFTNDDYNKLVLHLQNCKEEGCLVSQYLLLAFNPLIISISKRFRDVWVSDWPELILLVRSRFINLLYKYEVGGKIYFRYFMSRALLFDVRDCIAKERRQQGLTTWSVEKPMEMPEEQNDGYWIREGNAHSELIDKLDTEIIVNWIQTTDKLTELERNAFILNIQGYNTREIRKFMPGHTC